MSWGKSARMTTAPPPPRFRETRRSLPIALLRARETVMTPIRAMLSESPLNEQKWRVLRVIDEGGPMEQTAIARAACLLLPSLTRILQTLEAEGLLVRSSHPEDRRKTTVALTDAGREMIGQYADRSRAILDRLEEEFGAEKLNRLLDLLDELQALDLTPNADHKPQDF